MNRRAHLVINAGNLLELVGAAITVYGLSRLAGLGWALILAGVLLVIGAELIYDQSIWRLPLPRKPRIRERLAHRRDRLRARALRAGVTFSAWRGR